MIDRESLRVLVHAAALGAIGVTDTREKENLRALLATLQEVLDVSA